MSKELEALQRIKKFYSTWRLSNREAFNLVESALKAFELIKKKEMLSVFQDIHNKCFISFNNMAIEIPQQEYDILKEALL